MNQPERPIESLKKQELINLIKEVEEQLNAIKSYHQELLEGDESTGEESVKAQISRLHEELGEKKSTLNGHITRIEHERTEVAKLTKQARDLLLDASTGKLAQSFQRLKKRYGSDRAIEWRGLLFYCSFVTFLALIFCYTLALVLLTFEGETSSWKNAELPKIVYLLLDIKAGTDNKILGLFAQFAPIIPLTWGALHLNRIINLRRKLYEEYSFKQGIMVLYTGLREKKAEAHNQGQGTQEYDKTLNNILEQVIQPPQYVSDKTRDDNPLSSMFLPFFRRISRKDIKEIVEEILKEKKN